MTLPTALIAFDVSDQLGNEFWEGRSKATMTVEVHVDDDTIVDVDGNQIRVGGGTVAVGADGTGEVPVWEPAAGSIPESWQTSLHLEFPNREAWNKRTTKTFGPFTVHSTNRTVTNKALAGNVATITTSEPHRLDIGNQVTIAGVDGTFNGTYTITAVGSPTTLSYAKTNANVGSAASGGTLTSPHVRLADLVDEMPVLPVYESRFSDRIDGVKDHGNVSGALTIDPAVALHGLDATGPTVLTLGSPPGNTVSVKVVTGADDVTVAGMPDAELTDGAWATFVYFREAWELASAGGGGVPSVPDTTPPSAVTDLTATGGEGEIVLDWSAATDAENAVSYRYRVWLTSGGEPAGTTGYVTTTDTAATVTGLAAGAYTAQVYAYSAGGASAVDFATATVTAVPGYSTLVSDAFTGSDGTLAGHVPDITPDGAAWSTGNSPDFIAIASNKITHNAAGYNPAATLLIPTQTLGIGVALDVAMAVQPDTSTPALGVNLVSPDNGDDLGLTLFMVAGALSVELSQGNGKGNVALDGTISGLPLTGRYALRWRLSDKSVSILHDGVEIATGTTSNPSYSRDFKRIRMNMSGYKSSTVDNFVVEAYT